MDEMYDVSSSLKIEENCLFSSFDDTFEYQPRGTMFQKKVN